MKPALYHYSTPGASHSCAFKGICSFLLALFFCQLTDGQDSVKAAIDLPEKKIVTSTPPFKTDSLLIYPYNKKRVKIIAAAHIVGYSAALVALNYAWYKDYPRSGFHVFNDF